MTEKDLKELGFKKTKVPAEESGASAFYYYTYNFKKGTGWGLHLISIASDDVVDKNGWSVEIIESGLKPFTSKRDIKRYIKLIEKYE